MDTKTIKIPKRAIQDVTFKPDGSHLVVADSSCYIREWTVDGGQEVTQSTISASGSVYAIVASTDGRWIVSGDSGNKVTVWDAVAYKIAIVISEHTGSVYAVDVSNDSTRVASGSDDGTVRVFGIISGIRVIPPLEHCSAPVGVKFSPDGSQIATATLTESVGVYDAYSGNKLFDTQVRTNWTSVLVNPLVWSSDTQLFVASKGKISAFDASTSHHSEWFVPDEGNNSSIVAHGQFIARSAGPFVSFWDCVSYKQIGSAVINHTTAVRCISISHDGQYLACGYNNGVTIHNLYDYLPQTYFSVPLAHRAPLIQVSEAVFDSWIRGDATDIESTLSREIEQSSNPNHYTLAARSLVRARQKEWKTAMEDAEMSIQIKWSPIGQIAMSLALAGSGKLEAALDDFDITFHDADPSDIMLLLVIKSMLIFTCGKHEQAVSRLRRVIASANEKTRGHYAQILGNMYLKQSDYENAVQILASVQNPSNSTPNDHNPLLTISLIFNWNFDHLNTIAWQRLCETLYTSGSIKGVGETLLRMVSQLSEDEKEPAHGHVLKEIVTRFGEVTLLSWTGKSSRCNSCLPSSPAVYSQEPFISPCLEQDALKERTNELRDVFPLVDALMIYGCLAIRLQPVRFIHFQLHLPCIVFGVTSLRQEQENVYHAETTGLGGVEFTTTDSLSLKEPQRLVFVDTRIHGLNKPRDTTPLESDAELNLGSWNSAGTDVKPAHASLIEEATSTPQDAYTRALELIAHLGQPFSALLLLRQSDGAYKRVAADHEIVVRGMGNNFLKDIRVEVLQVL